MIDTKRLAIRRLRVSFEEISKQIAWLNDPVTMRYSEQRHKKHNTATQIAYIDSIVAPNKLVGIYRDNELIGTMSAYVDEHNSVADVGILVGRNEWGHGYGAEAWAAFCDYLLGNGVRKVEAGMMANHFGMIGICRKYGMLQEGRRYNHFLVGDELVDLTYFGKAL